METEIRVGSVCRRRVEVDLDLNLSDGDAARLIRADRLRDEGTCCLVSVRGIGQSAGLG